MKELIAELERLGFYSYTPPWRIDAARADAVRTGYLFAEFTHRDFMADAEELAEGGVLECLALCWPFLTQQGILIEDAREEVGEGDGYSVWINDQRFWMYTEEELGPDCWVRATNRMLEMLNTLLKDAGSNERAFTLEGGNDQQLVFLTEAQYAAIRRSPAIPERNKPEAAPVG